MSEEDDARQYRHSEDRRAERWVEQDQLHVELVPSTSDLRTIELPRASPGQTSVGYREGPSWTELPRVSPGQTSVGYHEVSSWRELPRASPEQTSLGYHEVSSWRELPRASPEQASLGYHEGPSWRAGESASSLLNGTTEMSRSSDGNSRFRATELESAGQWKALYDVRNGECERLTAQSTVLNESLAQLKAKYKRLEMSSDEVKHTNRALITHNVEIMRLMKDLEVKFHDLEHMNTLLTAEQNIHLSLNSDLQTKLSFCKRGFGPDPTSEAAFQVERRRHISEMARMQNHLDDTQIKLTLKSNECVSKSKQLETELANMHAIKMDHTIEMNDLIQRLDACNNECFTLRMRQNFSGPSEESDVDDAHQEEIRVLRKQIDKSKVALAEETKRVELLLKRMNNTSQLNELRLVTELYSEALASNKRLSGDLQRLVAGQTAVSQTESASGISNTYSAADFLSEPSSIVANCSTSQFRDPIATTVLREPHSGVVCRQPITCHEQLAVERVTISRFSTDNCVDLHLALGDAYYDLRLELRSNPSGTSSESLADVHSAPAGSSSGNWEKYSTSITVCDSQSGASLEIEPDKALTPPSKPPSDAAVSKKLRKHTK